MSARASFPKLVEVVAVLAQQEWCMERWIPQDLLVALINELFVRVEEHFYTVTVFNRAMTCWNLCTDDETGCEGMTKAYRRHKREIQFYYLGTQPLIDSDWAVSAVGSDFGPPSSYDSVAPAAIKSLQAMYASACAAIAHAKETAEKSLLSGSERGQPKQDEEVEASDSIPSTPHRQLSVASAQTGAAQTSKRKASTDDAFTPLMKALKSKHPIKSKATVAARQNKEKLEWKNVVRKQTAASTLRKERANVTFFLQTLADNNPNVAADLIIDFIKCNKKVGEFVTSHIGEKLNNVPIARTITDSMKEFTGANLSSKGGRVPHELNNAMDGIVCGSVYSMVNNGHPVPVKGVASALGVSKDRVNKCVKHVGKLLCAESITPDSKLPFHFPVMKVRKDCTQQSAFVAVHNWCHSKNASEADPNINRKCNVTVPHSREKEEHTRRVWLEMGWENRLKQFQNSAEYENFQSTTAGATIAMTVFRKSVCSCIHDPKPRV